MGRICKRGFSTHQRTHLLQHGLLKIPKDNRCDCSQWYNYCLNAYGLHRSLFDLLPLECSCQPHLYRAIISHTQSLLESNTVNKVSLPKVVEVSEVCDSSAPNQTLNLFLTFQPMIYDAHQMIQVRALADRVVHVFDGSIIRALAHLPRGDTCRRQNRWVAMPCVVRSIRLRAAVVLPRPMIGAGMVAVASSFVVASRETKEQRRG